MRLRFTFGEVPTDVAEPFYPYKGELSEAWLPDELINVDYLPHAVRMPRRYAFRYVKIEVLDTSPEFRIRFEDLKAHAVTSARGTPAPLAKETPLMQRIDAVSIATLRDCMQTTFEDGPRRDRRLWVGDLRLQALTNYHTFRSNDVVRRCLYLFAALPRADGLVAACVFEKPAARYGGLHIVDYAALFNVTLFDYVEATGDLATGRDLWPVARAPARDSRARHQCRRALRRPEEHVDLHRLVRQARSERGDPGRAHLRVAEDTGAGAPHRPGIRNRRLRRAHRAHDRCGAQTLLGRGAVAYS